MKKTLLFCLALGIAMLGYTQKSSIPKLSNPEVLNKSVKVLKSTTDGTEVFENSVNYARNTGSLTPEEYLLGTTFFDYVSNLGVGNRFHRWDDGTMAAAWILGFETGGFTDRGTGYNYFDGTAWDEAPTVRLEPYRCGWPSITAWGPNGEINAAHNTSDDVGCHFVRRENKGEGEWTHIGYDGPDEFPKDPTFANLISSGENNEYTHFLYNAYQQTYNDVEDPLFYSRSDDGGDTWEIKDYFFEEFGSDYYRENPIDGHIWASKGNTLAFLNVSRMIDLVLMKSTDNGESWEKTVIWENPYPFMVWDGANSTLFDSLYTTDGAGDIDIDADGKVHVVFGITKIRQDDGGRYSYPFVDGLGYWNEDMPMFNEDGDNISALCPPNYGNEGSEMIEDVNYIGWAQDIDGDGEITWATDDADVFYNYRVGGLSSQPQITIDEDGRIFVVFASSTESYVYNGEMNYKHIWARAYDNGGWGEFTDLSADITHFFDECVFPVMAKTSDEYIYYYYMADATPGFGSGNSPDHEVQENRIIFAKMLKETLLTGISETGLQNNMMVDQNIPNPFSTTTTVNVHLKQSANLSIEVTNMIGQKVYAMDRGKVSSGYHHFTLTADQLDAGIYFYTVTAGNNAVTKKMIVQ